MQRSEFVRQLILDEIGRCSKTPQVSPELVEICGLRLLLTNLLRVLATGGTVTPKAFDEVIVIVKEHKEALAATEQGRFGSRR